ncbi:MAG: glycosyltransferase [Candidatus Micrarchaeia archaeon]|jgi:glycosyltransferase involved in cell wall biosynthesis
MDISDKKIAVCTHYLAYGGPQALRDFLIQKKAGTISFIGLPLFPSAQNCSFFEKTSGGKTATISKNCLSTGISFVDYLLQFFLELKFIYKTNDKYDLFVGADPLNAFAGILLKKAGKTRKTIFYTIDYVPRRFDNFFLNRIYRFLDRFCVKHSDETWTVSQRIISARKDFNQIPAGRQKVVPIGVWPKKVHVLPFSKVNRFQLIFIGYLVETQGLQSVIDAVPLILRKIPRFSFKIVGDGEYAPVLKKKVADLGLERSVVFTGWKQRSELDEIIPKSALAIAPYKLHNEQGDVSLTFFADPTKIKDYLSAGVPVLLTSVPHNASEIQKSGCGKIIVSNPKSIAAAVIEFLKNEEKLKNARKNALNYANKYDWNDIFETALKPPTL